MDAAFFIGLIVLIVLELAQVEPTQAPIVEYTEQVEQSDQ